MNAVEAMHGRAERRGWAMGRATAHPTRRWLPASLRGQVLGTVLAINVAAALMAGWVVVLNARAATRDEMSASVEMAEQVVREAAERIAADPGALDTALPRHLRHMRHVRLSVRDSAGRVLWPSGADPRVARSDGAPAWFSWLVGVEEVVRTIDITADGTTLARVTVAGVPDDEIAEVWEDVTDFASVALAVDVAILAALFLALGRVRRDLSRFRAALGALERARFTERLAPPRTRELAELADGVNALAEALDAARRENVRLTACLVRLEEDERSRIAGELHDELGPLMFGLKAGADSLARLAAQAPPELAGKVAARTGSLIGIVERMQSANRSLLRRIRPAALGHVPFADALASLLADFRQHDPERLFQLEAGPLRTHYGAAIEATLYRCAQEGVTNALKHGDARAVRLRLAEACDGEGQARLRLTVCDDGRGPSAVEVHGLGLSGMRERVRALGGRCELRKAAGGGALLHVEIDIPAQTAGAPLDDEQRS